MNIRHGWTTNSSFSVSKSLGSSIYSVSNHVYLFQKLILFMSHYDIHHYTDFWKHKILLYHTYVICHPGCIIGGVPRHIHTMGDNRNTPVIESMTVLFVGQFLIIWNHSKYSKWCADPCVWHATMVSMKMIVTVWHHKFTVKIYLRSSGTT